MYDVNQDMEKKSEIEVKKYLLKITGYDSFTDEKLKVDYILISLKEVSNFFLCEIRQYVKEGKTPLYEGFTGNDGNQVASSQIWDIKEAIKTRLGDVLYEQRKQKAKGINKTFFVNAEFEMDVKSTISGDKTYYYLQTSKQVIKDEDYRKNGAGTFVEGMSKKLDNSNQVEESLSNGLPF